MLKEINDDDKDESKNPTSNDNLTRFVPVSVTILILYFYSCARSKVLFSVSADATEAAGSSPS